MIGISMRMTQTTWPNGISEMRDCLAQSWQPFLRAALPGEVVLPLPNMGRHIEAMLPQMPISGFILSGGDDWGVFPQRDETEAAIFAFAQSRSLPILGVCRGAQVINLLLGGSLSPGCALAHRGTRHGICFQNEALTCVHTPKCAEVNSFHNNCIFEHDLAQGIKAWGICEDGSIEAFSGAGGLCAGIIWHPEREVRPDPVDMEIFAKHFSRSLN